MLVAKFTMAIKETTKNQRDQSRSYLCCRRENRKANLGPYERKREDIHMCIGFCGRWLRNELRLRNGEVDSQPAGGRAEHDSTVWDLLNFRA